MKMLSILLFSIWTCVAAQKPSYQIGILMDENTAPAHRFLEDLQNQIQLVVGEEADLFFPPANILFNHFNLQKASNDFQQLEASEVDLIIAIGRINHAAISTRPALLKPTIVFGHLTQDWAGINVNTKNTVTPNLNLLIEQKSLQNDIQQFQEIANFQKLGILVEGAVLKAYDLEAVFDSISSRAALPYQFISLESVLESNTLPEQVDAVYLIGGQFMNEQSVQHLGKILLNKKVPSFTINGPQQVENGLMVTNSMQEQTELVIRRMALTVEQYVNERSLAAGSSWLEHPSQLTLNYNISEAIELPFKMNFVEKMSFVSGNPIVKNKYQQSLMALVKEAIDNNLSLKAARQNILLRSQDVQIAKSNYLPRVDAALSSVHTDADFAELGFGQTPEFMTAGSLSFEQMIFSKKINTNVEIQKTLEKAEVEKLNTEELNLISKTINQYFNILIAKTNLELQLRNLKVSKKNYQIANQNYDAGLFNKTDALRFKSAIAQNTQAMVEAGNWLERELNNLNQLLNRPVDQKIDVEDLVLDDESLKGFKYDELLTWLDHPNVRTSFIRFVETEAQKNSPELRTLSYQMDANQRAIDLSDKGRFLPTVAFQGQFNSVFDRSGSGSTAFEGVALPNNYYQVGLNVSLPVFDRNQNNLKKQRSIIRQNQISMINEQTKMDMGLRAHNTVLDLIDRIANIELSAVSEEAAQEALQMSQTAYSNGAVNSAQLIDAQNNLLNAQLRRANAIYTYLRTALQIERLIGHYFFLNSDEENLKLKQRALNQF